MFIRANASLGSNWSLHDLRHSAAYRMARDPQMTLSDVQWVLGHAQLSTTQLYLTAPTEDVIAAVLAYHAGLVPLLACRRLRAGHQPTLVRQAAPPGLARGPARPDLAGPLDRQRGRWRRKRRMAAVARAVAGL